MRRPSIAAIGVFWAGLVAARSMPLSLLCWVLILIATTVLMLIVRRDRIWFLLLLACVFALGCIRSPEAGWNRVGVEELVAGRDKFPCIVKVRGTSLLAGCSEPAKVTVESVVIGYPWLEKKRVFLRGPEMAQALSDGAATAAGTFYAPRRRLNPYGWDTALRYEREGVAGTVVARSFVEVPTRGGSFIPAFRKRIRNLISSAGSKASRGVLEALLLGERADLSPEVKDIMIRAGTYHVIAISGLHVGIVVLLVTSLITIAGPPRGLRIALAVVCVFAYVLFTGARPSAQRAGTFFLLVSFLRYLQWKVDLANCVCAAGIILLVVFPHLAWDVGFRLSLAAVFGITLLVPELAVSGRPGRTPLCKVRDYIRLGMLVSFSAQAATLPILLYHFGRVSILGIVSNLVILPLVTLAVAAGLEASVSVLLWERLGLIFMKGASGLVTLMITLTSLLTRYVDPVVFAGRPGPVKLITYVCAMGYLGLLSPRLKRRWRLVFLILLYAFLVFPFGSRSGPEMVMTFIHVGDGDACLVEFPRGTTMLIDAGAGGGDYDAGRLNVLPLLAMKGVKHVHTVIITHSHNDHYGGLTALLGSINVGRVLVGTSDGEAGYVEVLDNCRGRDIEVSRIGRGDTLFCEGASIEVLHPSEASLLNDAGDPNAQSVVFRLVYGETRVLLTGDLTPEVQGELVGLGFDLACDVLKVPHHGAPDGVDPAFAKACGAVYGVISVGSRFASHPSPETIDLLEASGIRVLTTLWDGAVTVVTDGTGLEVRAEVLGPVRPECRAPRPLFLTR